MGLTVSRRNKLLAMLKEVRSKEEAAWAKVKK
jgi:hypothetical protein